MKMKVKNNSSLEQRIHEVVKKYCPQMESADALELAAFLCCECWSIINEYIMDWTRTQLHNMRKSITRRNPSRKDDENANNNSTQA